MSTSPRVVVRFNQWYDPAMAERFSREPEIKLVTVEREGADDIAWSALATANAFQISSAKDELPRRWFVTEDMLTRCPRLLCVSSNGAGYDTIDVAACTSCGVLVVNQAGGNAQSVAEHAIGLMLDVARKMSYNDRLLRRERGFSREDLMGREMSGKTVGLVGIGHIGSRVAKLARAFGMTVLAVDPYLTAEEIERRGAQPTSFGELLQRSDFVSLHCPRDKDTLKLMDAFAFKRMKKGSVFVTTARGGIHAPSQSPPSRKRKAQGRHYMARVPVEMSPQREAVLVVVRRAVESGRAWVKLTAPYLGSKSGPPTYQDAGLVVADLVKLNPEQMLWGTDWPHPTHQKHLPDDAVLVDGFVEWVPDQAQRRRILVENPKRLYGF